MQNSASITKLIRSMHRDIGFLVIGLTLIYSLSGILLIYRDTSFLKSESLVTKTIQKNLKAADLGRAIHVRTIKPVKEKENVIYFTNGKFEGTYNKLTGETAYINLEVPYILEKLNNLHKSTNKGTVHWFTTIYGVLLAFLAMSSFWMYKPNTKKFKRGMNIALVGVVVSIVLIAMY